MGQTSQPDSDQNRRNTPVHTRPKYIRSRLAGFDMRLSMLYGASAEAFRLSNFWRLHE
jgi:hypothetical protein